MTAILTTPPTMEQTIRRIRAYVNRTFCAWNDATPEDKNTCAQAYLDGLVDAGAVPLEIQAYINVWIEQEY